MKSWVRNRRLAAGILVVVAVGLSATAFAAAGRTVGTFQVSPTGAATYTIPIWAPRGPAGLQPQIALTYDSQSASGYLGVGWNLGGMSSIYRCTQTYDQDPAPAPVSLTTSDVFCMDGNRLRLTGGTYGAADSTYQTEVANFANVTAYGSAGNGPSYFEVQGRDGRTYEYGNSGGSQVLAYGTTTAWIWYLDKVTDRAGNTMAITYCAAVNPNCDGVPVGASSVVPSKVYWTPSSSGAATYNYMIEFDYTSNAPQSSIYGYVGGTPYSNTSLLSTITVEYGGTTVKKYALTYAQSPTTGRDELTQVQECADSGETNCLAPTSFTYQSGQLGVSTSSSTALTATNESNLSIHNDFAGNGLDDLAYCNNGSPNVIYVVFASGSAGYGSPVNTEIPCNTPLYGDVSASGKDGILVGNGADWWYYTWNGSGFSGQDTGLAYDSTAIQYALADVNGDGFPDLVSVYLTQQGQQGSNTYNIDVRLNATFNGGDPVSFSSNSSVWATEGGRTASVISNTDSPGALLTYGTLKSFDFNGDGRQDLFLQVGIGGGDMAQVRVYELISGSSSFTQNLITQFSPIHTKSVYLLDFNSDGCTDYAINGVIYFSGCDGTVPQQISLGGATVIGAMDWDGDGHTDILVANGSTIGVYLSEGDGISGLQSTSIPYDYAAIYVALDENGDGLDDLGVYTGTGISYYLHAGAGQKPDLLSSVTDGYGNFAKPTYVSLLQGTGSTYTPGSGTPTGPIGYEWFTGSLYVVKQVTYSDPSNQPAGTYTDTYSYTAAAKNIRGRGFVGFATQTVADSRTGIYETIGYDQWFPFTGMVESDVATQGNDSHETIFSRSYSIGTAWDWGSGYNWRDFPAVYASSEDDYQVGGPENGALIASKSGQYGHDQYGNLTQETLTVTDKDSGSPYDGDSWTTKITNTPDADTGTWCLGLLNEQQISYTASDGSPSVTRTRQYTPDTTNCRYTEIQTEPSSNSYEVTEALGYDGFGNINSDTVTGIGMSARQSTANWGTTGQFPMSVTDAMGATTQFNYDFKNGFLSSKTDPNGLTTSWQDGDGFGRVTKETRPDGTYTLYYYSPCDSSNTYCRTSQPDLRLFVQNKYYGSDGAEIDERDLYENAVDAIRFNTIYNISGKVYVVTYYDALGRVVAKSVPHIGTEYDTTYSYDILNRLTRTQRQISQNDSTLQTTSYAYQGDTTTITDPNGNIRTLVHDPNGWLRETTDDLGYAITLGYDAAGAKTSMTDNLSNGPSDPLWTGTYAYGISPFLIGETDVDRGTWGYTVDALGERTASADPKGQQFHEQYDALSRLVTRTEPDLFTQWTWGSSAASHNIGKLQGVCTGTGSSCSSGYYSESESYDSLARLYQRSIAIPSMGTYTYTWQYNATGNIDTLTYPVSTSGQALELKYAYHTGSLQSITDVLDSPNVTIWQANAQSPQGQYTQEALGNGLVTNRVYDAVTDWLSSVQSGAGGGAAVQNQSFLYDQVGNLTQRQDNNLGLTENFYYDGDNRLSYSTLNGKQNLSLNYDEKGNITSRSDVASGADWTYNPTHVHEVTQAGSSAYAYAYDANGNMTSRQGSSITWTSYNYPATINDTATGESVSFSYGPDRHAWLEKMTGSSGTELAYHVGGLLDIVSSSGVTDYRHYIYAGSEPIAIDSRKSNGTNAFYYFLSDHQGSITKITNGSGAVVIGESFTAYGNRRNPTTWSGAPTGSDLTTIAGITRHGYTFQDALGTMGLNDMVGRVQDAITGRFLSADPVLQDSTDAQDYNSYSYVLNNPLTNIDPTGFDCNFGPDGTDFSLGCDITAPPDEPGLCIECFLDPAPGVPLPGWPGVPYRYPSNTPPQPRPPTMPRPRSPGRTPGQIPCTRGKSCSQTPQDTQPHQSNPRQTQCHLGTSFGSGLIQYGRQVAEFGGATAATGGAIIAGGAVVTSTIVGAPEGAAVMAAGAAVADAGGTFAYVGVGMQAIGSVINAARGNYGSLIGSGLQVTASGINATVGHFFPNLPDVLGPFNPVDVAADDLGDRVGGGGACL